MYEKLSTCVLPVDYLLQELYEKESLHYEMKRISMRSGNHPIKNLVTLDLVKNQKIGKVVRDYISTLLDKREKYGYLYYLMDIKKSMMNPLNIRFRGMEVFSNPMERDEIFSKMNELASEFACRTTLMFEITLLECFYFYVRLANRHLTWIALESILNNVKSHIYLIMEPKRKHGFETDEKWVNKWVDKWMERNEKIGLCRFGY